MKMLALSIWSDVSDWSDVATNQVMLAPTRRWKKKWSGLSPKASGGNRVPLTL